MQPESSDSPEQDGANYIGAVLARIRETRDKDVALRFARGVAIGVAAILAREKRRGRE
jgi:hypothetical protein